MIAGIKIGGDWSLQVDYAQRMLGGRESDWDTIYSPNSVSRRIQDQVAITSEK